MKSYLKYLSFFFVSLGLVTFASSQSSVAERVDKIIVEPEGNGSSNDPSARRIASFYASFMDTTRTNTIGLKPIQKLLDEIARANSKKQIADLYGRGNFVFAPFRVDLTIDPNNPERYAVMVSQYGLHLRTREPYISKDEKAELVREQFVDMVSKMLEMANVKDSRLRAKKILAFETAFAAFSRVEDQSKDNLKNTRIWTKDELIHHAPGFEWKTYFESNRMDDPNLPILIGQPAVIRGTAQVIENTDLETLKDHLIFSAICTWGYALHQSIFDLEFDLRRKMKSSITEKPDRRTQGIRLVDRTLGDDVGRRFVSKHFPLEYKRKIESKLPEVVARLKSKLRDTDGNGKIDIDRITIEIGFPNRWADYNDLKIRRDDLYGNAVRVHFWNWSRAIALLKKPVDMSDMWVPAHWTRIVYIQKRRRILIPAGFLQPPVFDPSAKEPVDVELLADAIVKAVQS